MEYQTSHKQLFHFYQLECSKEATGIALYQRITSWLSLFFLSQMSSCNSSLTACFHFQTVTRSRLPISVRTFGHTWTIQNSFAARQRRQSFPVIQLWESRLMYTKDVFLTFHLNQSLTYCFNITGWGNVSNSLWSKLTNNHYNNTEPWCSFFALKNTHQNDCEGSGLSFGIWHFLQFWISSSNPTCVSCD